MPKINAASTSQPPSRMANLRFMRGTVAGWENWLWLADGSINKSVPNGARTVEIGLKIMAGRMTLDFELRPADFIFRAMNNTPILQLDLPGIKKVRSGKVREV